MNRAILLFILIFSKSVLSFGQTNTIDRLLKDVYSAEEGRDKLTAILALCEEYQSLNRDTLDYYSFKAREMAQTIGHKRSADLAELAVANDYLRWGWTDSAVAVLDAVIKKNSLAIPDERDIHFKASRQMALGYGGKSKFSEALAILYRVVEAAEKYKDTLVVSTNLNTIGSIALERETPFAALKWFRDASSYVGEDPRYNGARANIYVNMAQAFLLADKLDSAVSYSEKGLRLLRAQQNLHSLAIALQRQSRIFMKTGDLKRAEDALREMVEVRTRVRDSKIWVDDNTALVDFYINTHQIDKAIAYCNGQLLRGNLHGSSGPEQTFTNALSLRLDYYNLLARCYKVKGDSKSYERTLEQIILAKDSLSDALAEQQIAEMQTKYEVQKKENTIIQQQLTIARKNNVLFLGLAVAVIVAVVGFLFFREYRRKQKYKMAQMIEQEKNIAAKAVADAEEKERKRIAADLHDNLGAYAASIAFNLDMINAGGVPEKNRSALQELNNNSQTMVAQLSDTIWALNKDTLTLTAISDRIKVFLNRIRKTYNGIDMEVAEHIEQDIELPPTQAFHLFQIIQEAVINAVKHSGTKQLKIEMEGLSNWQIRVIDYGSGLCNENRTPSVGGNGLKNMKTRAAASGWEISWRQTDPSGTSVIIRPMNTKI